MLKAKGGKKHSGGKDFMALAGLEKPPKMGNAEMWYLGHCGWAIRTKNHLMIFDYFPNRTNPTEPSLANGRINPEELKNLNVEVFVTHDHRDHYDSSIYFWQPTVKDMTYILDSGRSSFRKDKDGDTSDSHMFLSMGIILGK
jgi:L-ascorbate metabolism protein UlaG (beta-lactamase superfamily)